ncbi:FAD-binding oxidoreductase [Candidatus Viridilinea mediisalina]|uniref:FAD-binding PCMH-type domain-containing protein n=1 Tax=Candidatus Viridilinea mediisalina TaxID=2024553 RepID=A0A2A6RDQ1_9CHLR|nr:FAD-linked oxidase C-terminal domain-containing protein [Candidatus Viridilinea mediisalina]PDW00659.1 hypothetical protein CJ255_20355 [Candidatus Viridilinea mediisalina]
MTPPLKLERGALVVTVSATLTPEALNVALAHQQLFLPLEPLLPDLSLATLLARNAGGRRRLRYGPLGRYLRAALLEDANGTHVMLGGPTLKRATGYGLWRALAGGERLALGRPLSLTLSLCPLPPVRALRLLRCANLAAACRLGVRLDAAGFALSALAFARNHTGAGLLLAELEQHGAVVARQLEELDQLAQAEGAELLATPEHPWAMWEALAATQVALGSSHTLDLTLPRGHLAGFVAQAERAAQHYGSTIQLWGDAGLGALHLVVPDEGLGQTPPPDGSVQALLATIRALAQRVGGQLATELGVHAPVAPPELVAPPLLHESRASSPRRPDEGVPPAFPGLRLSPTLNSDRAACAFPTDQFRAIVGPRYLLTHPDELACYELDASIAQPAGAALAVAIPGNTAEVAALVRLAATHGIPLVCRGAGSGLAGGSVPSPGALVLALNRLDQIEIDITQQVARVGVGATTAEVQRAAETQGLCYPPDPSSQIVATIGGNLACNAGGPRCVKYGVTADYLLAVTAVLADGRVVQWGDGLIGQGCDQSLAQLLVGSEGTLAIITGATLRLIAAPRTRRTTMALFASLEAACATVEQIRAAGLVPAGMELMDGPCLAAVEAYIALGLPHDTGAMLLLLADGEPEAVHAETQHLADLAHQGGATLVESARTPADEGLLWQARRAVSIALTRLRPRRLGEDICVPVTQIAACVAHINAISTTYGLPIVVFGHAGDGNLHPNILFDPSDPDEMARLWPCAHAVFAAALAVGGTLSGEHGIGSLKRPFMAQALSGGELAAQRRIKALFDPLGLLNPGKVLP